MASQTPTLCAGALLVLVAAGGPRPGHASPLVAQVEPETAGGAQSGQGPRLVRQVRVEYPADAPEGLVGTVDVRVGVAASGKVDSVEVVDGPEPFHAAAVEAAWRLEFAPAVRAGQPVAGAARVHFHFEEEHDDTLPLDGEEVVVTAHDPDRDDTRARTTLDEAAVERSVGASLAESAASVAGVQVARTSGSTAKPIIRGQSERRLLLMVDGVRHESQKWGADHAPEVDLQSAGSVTVIKGPAGARYGPDAIGGVLLVVPPPMRADPGVGGKVVAMAGTNGRRGLLSARLDARSETHARWSGRVEGSVHSAAAMQAPDYVLGNTAAKEWTAGGALQWRSDDTVVRLRVHHFDRAAGVFFGVRQATPTEFEAQLSADAPVGADGWKVSRTIERPYQAVAHDLASVHVDHSGVSGWQWTSIYAFQRNHREEFDQVRDPTVTLPQFDFTLRTHSLDLEAEAPVRRVGRRQLHWGLGTQGSFQENVYRGLALIPNHRSFAGGLFAHGRLEGAAGAVSAGARADGLRRTAYLKQDDYDRHDARGTLAGVTCAPYAHGEACDASDRAASLSLGGLWHVVPEVLDAKLDLSSASRFPAVDELYLLGAAPSLPVYALGNPGLGVETTWGASPTLGLRTPWVEAEASGYGNLVEDFIYFAPALDPAGDPAFTVTIDGAWPEYAVRPIPALFYGGDGFVDLGPQEFVGLRVQGSVVRGIHRTSGDHLVGVPGDSAAGVLCVRPPPPGSVQDWEIGLRADLVGKQSRVDPTHDLAPAPDAVVLYGAHASAEIARAGRIWRIGLSASNLLDTAMREYTSLLRYYADQPGRDVRARVGLEF